MSEQPRFPAQIDLIGLRRLRLFSICSILILMQIALAFGQSTADLIAIRNRLRDRFGTIRDDLRHDPVSQLVKTAISGRTRDEISSAAFERLVAGYWNVEQLAEVPVEDIEAMISDVAYAESKAIFLREAVRTIRAREGRVSLDFLHDWPVDLAFRWLEMLPGIGIKGAAAVLNFSTLRKRIFVVDAHVQRVLQRFGFVGPKADAEDVRDEIMAAADGFTADDLYELHWLLKYLGQQICGSDNPRCGDCPLGAMCMKRVSAKDRRHAAPAGEIAATV
jgi:endonuclease III